MSAVRFYKVSDSYGFFSNFSPQAIFLNGEIWLTVEHYFQAAKFLDNNIKDKIKSTASPMQAALEGRNSKNIIRSDWEMIKEEVMKKALMAKFMQHPNLRKELLETNQSLIVEDTVNDNYWGNGGDDSGKNRLGILLMEVRSELYATYSDSNVVLPPWIAFPEVSQFDMFWRMGLGEDYISVWAGYYLGLDDKDDYKKKFPPKGDWELAYD